MGKDKVEKKDRAEKKEKRAEKDGVHKAKKEKKEKKDKTALVDAVEKELSSQMEGVEQTGAVAVKGEIEVDAMAVDRPVGAVVPFANPLVEDKQAKKVLKSVKKGMWTVPQLLPENFCHCCAWSIFIGSSDYHPGLQISLLRNIFSITRAFVLT
jgi:hypothetical protein